MKIIIRYIFSVIVIIAIEYFSIQLKEYYLLITVGFILTWGFMLD